MRDILCILISLYVIALFARIVLSWFPIPPNSPMAPVFSVLYAITEPVLAPVRRLLPPVGVGGMGLDLSPLIVSLAVSFVIRPILC
ncbi:MAG: YggT family protein [Acidimicrobiales bacterium]